MRRTVYLFKFKDAVSMQEVEETLYLSMFASEGIHGRARVRLEKSFLADPKLHACAIDGSTAVGVTIAQVFTGLLTREIGEDAFSVHRVIDPPPPQAPRSEQALN